MSELVGQRIARYRARNGWTQEELAERVAISRVAVSHIEMGLSVPSERTVVLLASVFRCHPYELVQDTTYPLAKAERLPHAIAWYSPMDLQFALLDRDLAWLNRIARNTNPGQIVDEIVEEWLALLNALLHEANNGEERARVIQGRKALLTARESILKHLR